VTDLPKLKQFDYTSVPDLSEAGIEQRLKAIDLTEDDIARLGALDRHIASTPNALADVFGEVDAIGAQLRAPNSLTSVLKQLIAEITLCDFGLERLATEVQVWLAMQRLGLGSEWPPIFFSRYLSTMFEHCSALPSAHRVQLALQKTAMFHLGFIAQASVSEERAIYQYHALHDPDTGLPNHVLFQKHLRDALRTAQSQETMLALVRIQIMAAHRLLGYPGYPTIEQLMAAVAARIAEAIRPVDVLGQLGKTELALQLPKLRSEGQVMLAANKLLRTLEPAFVLNNLEIEVRPIMGAAIYPHHAGEADSLLRQAETARQSAGVSAENFVVYREDLDADQRLQRSLEVELRTALRENELLVYYQPQLELQSNKVRGAEALLRWKNRRGEFVPPNVIVEVAEQCGLISELTRWVLNTAVRHCAEFRREGVDIGISVNLSASDLHTPELVETVEQCLRTWNLAPEHLMLEITEGSMIRDLDKALLVLQRLEKVGVELSIDDFGTGYSSLSYLRRLPITELKIDQIFVREMLSVKADEGIVRTVIDLAHNLDLRVVAEGVEDRETMSALKALECDAIQGYVLTKPIPREEFKLWWEKNATSVA
jgi:diguanylate cyclase